MDVSKQVCPSDFSSRWPTCKIHPTAVIYGNVDIGDNNVIGPNCVLGYRGAIRGEADFDGVVEIGIGNTFGAGVVVCVGLNGVTKIGNSNILMNRVNIGHDVSLGDGCEIGAGSVIAGHAAIGNAVKVKIGCMVRNRITICHDAVVGMGAVVVSDVPAYETVWGNPATSR